ncbi:hypothetical protein KEM48_014013 [Puccinia striiformis f. sp. tritici PST-130]|nr:hypothetical protein KEM48_014013 [Puccinia striiformis f. sp. tritici PST-130]
MSPISTKMTSWFTETLLNEDNLRKRTRILEFLIKLGAKLLEMQNYNALILEHVGDKAQALFENVNKAKMMKIIDEIERFQVKFDFSEVSSITAYIFSLMSNLMSYQDLANDLYQHSLQVEPQEHSHPPPPSSSSS